MSDYIMMDPELMYDFVKMWGARWAPVGAANDPNGLNANWVHNVIAGWRGNVTNT
jgi:hypothetical protein